MFESAAVLDPIAYEASLVERIAHELATEVIAGSDLMVDLHSAGDRREKERA